jgi:hypothetical protein
MDDVHGEEEFRFPLMERIREYADENDISILAATRTVVPKYANALRWRDEAYNREEAKRYTDEIEANWKNSLLRKLT